jgi:hypothetical protein
MKRKIVRRTDKGGKQMRGKRREEGREVPANASLGVEKATKMRPASWAPR